MKQLKLLLGIKQLILFSILLINSMVSFSQNIVGETQPNQGDTESYYLTDPYGIYAVDIWDPFVGDIIGPDYYSSVNVQWNNAGTQILGVDFIDINTYDDYYTQINVYVQASNPATPSPAPTVQSTNCGYTILQRSTPPSGITWYWQSERYGTSTDDSGVTKTVTSGAKYYLRARNNSLGLWSDDSALVYYTLNESTTWYPDTDGDGLGDPNPDPNGSYPIVVNCSSQPSGYVSNGYDQCPTVSGKSINNGCLVAGNSNDKSYVQTVEPLLPIDNMSQLADEDQAIKSVVYYDGLGRPIQSVARRAGGIKNDIITPIVYDKFGRQTANYLPCPIPQTTLGYINNTTVVNNLEAYYSDKFSSQINSSSPNPYSETLYESSPMNSVLESGAPGHTWRVDVNVDTDHTVKSVNKTNETNEVYLIVYPGENTSLSLTSYYPAGRLIKNIVKNENWKPSDDKLNTKEVFTDKNGKKIAEFNYETPDEDDFEDYNIVKTYYVYDDVGNLMYILTPKIFSTITGTTISTTVLNNLAFQYKYDIYNRQIEQRVPGKYPEFMVYDQLDRPILTQDGNLTDDGEWLFNKYDAFGRVVYSGLFTSPLDRSALQTAVDNYISGNTNNLSNIESRTSASNIGSVTINYSNNAYPTSSLEVLTVNYYDDYGFADADKPTTPTSVLGQTVTARTKGLSTSSWSKTLGASSWTKNYNFYNEKGNIIKVYERNHMGGFTENSSKLDFRGKVEYSITNHRRGSSGNTLTIQDRFEYDHMERTKVHYQQVNDNDEEIIANNTYDELGMLVKKDIGGKNDTSIQFIDVVNVDIEGQTITKTSITGVEAGFATKAEITGDGYIQYEVAQTNNSIVVGLSSDNTNTSNTTIDYGIANSSGGTIVIFESGTHRGFFGSYQVGDIFRVERVGLTIYYKKNGISFYTSTIDSFGKLIGDVWMYQNGAKIKNLTLSNQFKDIENISVSGSTITKTGDFSVWDAGLATVKEIDGNGYVQYQVAQTDKAIMVGLSSDNTNSIYNTIDYALYTRHDGYVYVYESGANKTGAIETYQAGDILRVERKGTTIYYKKNGITLYISLVSSSGTLIGDLAMYQYQGKINNLEIHNAGLQTIDYTYNISGGLKAVNDVDNLGSDLFAYKLNRESGEGSNYNSNLQQYNGNISQMVWKSSHDNIKKTYQYSYDDLNRFVHADYGEGSSLTSNWGKFKVTVSDYDNNGNIIGLNRYGGSTNGTLIDDLTYNYNNGNVLNSIWDAASVSGGFSNGTTGNSLYDYEYDDSGNLTYDDNKDISDIEYNHLDLPKKVSFSNGNKIEFLYDATGAKLQMKFTPYGFTPIITDYIGGFQYKDDILQFFPTTEGYVDNNSGTYTYVYTLKDHLGNNRVAFKDANSDNVVNSSDILSSTDYYPMGMTHHGEFVQNSNYNYKYQGKEKLLANGYNMYDFGSRMYDASVGRWFNTDPQNQFSSPYLAMGNNWVTSIDPNGEFVFTAALVGAIIGAATAGVAYTATAIVNDDWNLGKFAGSVVGGALVGAISNGFASAGNAATLSSKEIGKAVLRGTLSAVTPSANIPISNNFSLSLSPAIAFGNSGTGIGANASINAGFGDFSASYGYGASYFGKAHGTGRASFETRSSWSASYSSGDFSASLYTTNFNSGTDGETSQRVGGIGFGIGDFNARIENDFLPGLTKWSGNRIGDDYDRYRTAAVQIGFRDFKAGFNLFTGDPSLDEGNYNGHPGATINGSYSSNGQYAGSNANKYRLGAAYFGYKGNRLGLNSESVRNAIQNTLHDKINSPRFPVLNIPNTFYQQFQSSNPFTLW